MDAFNQELMRRSPLAACVLEISGFVFDDGLLKPIWECHRGRCYEDVLTFQDFLRLMRDTLILRHRGINHPLQWVRREKKEVFSGLRDSLGNCSR